MKKKVLITLGFAALAATVYAGTRCMFCDGTGFANHGKSSFTCSFCGGSGHN